MNILHVNAHVSLYLDVRDILGRLGHRVYSWCLSGHLKLIGRDVPVAAHQALDGWPEIDASFCDRFAERYAAQLSGFDAFIVDHPVCFAALFERTGRPVIANATTRYDQGVTPDAARWRWLDDTLRRMFDRGQLLPMSNNRGDRAYAREHLGFDWPTVPSLCEYTGIRYSGEKAEWLHASLNHPPLPRPYAWTALGAYRGIIHVPYNCSQMSVIEHYAAAMPIVVPSEKRLLEMALADQHGAMAQVSFLRVHKLPPGNGLNDYRSAETLRRWIAWSDWFDDEWMPGTVQADDPFDADFLASLDARTLSSRVAAFLPARRRRILGAWGERLATAEGRSMRCA